MLRTLLAERGVSQAVLARATGYSTKHINQVIQGHAALSVALAAYIEDHLDGTRSMDGMAIRLLKQQTDYDLWLYEHILAHQ